MNAAPALRLRGGDVAPSLVLPLLAAAALPAMSFSTWLTLTVAGVAMGMMLFLMASGLTLIFGLMDVLNFAHGAFITLGAYVAVSVLAALAGWSVAESWWLNLAALLVALGAAIVASGTLGFVFERVIIRRVYGAHLRQILVTVGGLIVAEQLIVALWGPNPLPLPKPASFRGSIILGGAAIEKYRIIAVALGLAVYLALHFVLNRTRIGLLVRAGVENREMVEALGYRIHRLFIGVFVAGTALAGMGGVMWGVYQELVTRAIGADMTILVFIILIIGGLGSVGGCFVGALLVGLLTNYVAFLAPKLALGSNIMLMAAILLWRPRGLFPVAKE
ncbi:MAG TPA: branched-chain amino acid ABC transporter permease [Stellaceae bacterium]